MSGPFKTDPLATTLDILIDIGVLVFVAASFWPQVAKLRKENAVQGLSSFHVIFWVLFSNVQMSWAMMMMPFTWPNPRQPSNNPEDDTPASLLEMVGGGLGYLQIVVQWLAAVQVLMAFAAAQHDRKFARLLRIVWIVHTVLSVLPTSLLWLLNPRGHTMADMIATGVIVGPLSEGAFLTAPIFLVLQLISQLWRCRRRSADPGALSLLSVALQVVAYGLLTWRWSLRMGLLPRAGGTPSEASNAARAYAGGFLPINCLVMACSCMVLLLAYCRNLVMKAGTFEERKRVVVTWPRPYKDNEELESLGAYEEFGDRIGDK